MTLKNIAKQLGISPSTVSRIVNGNKNFSVSPELREKILALVKERGYKPNPVYQAMRQKQNRQIAIMLPNHLHVTGSSDISVGIDSFGECLLQEGYSFHYLSHTIRSQQTFGLPPWKVAGVMAVDVRHPELIAELDASSYPYVVLNGEAGERGCAIQTDEVRNMDMAMDHLYQLGHRKICYVNYYRSKDRVPFAWREYHYSVRQRTMEYEHFCQNHGIEPFAESFRTDMELATLIDVAMKKNCTAFVVYNSHEGIRTNFFLSRMGYRVPDDVSIILFNNSELCNYVMPPLTCVDIPGVEMGQVAARILLRQCRGQSEDREPDVLLPGKLIVRESTASCRMDS